MGIEYKHLAAVLEYYQGTAAINGFLSMSFGILSHKLETWNSRSNSGTTLLLFQWK